MNGSNRLSDRELERLFPGGGDMGERIRNFDWSKTPLGPIETWPQSLKTTVRIILTSRQPFWLGWGEQLIKLYNDPYKAIVGGKHPAALGQPAAVVWHEIWDEIGPMLKTAMCGVEGTYDEALLLIMERYSYREETYYTFSYSPVPNDLGGTGGILCANTDDTQRIIGERRLLTLRELAAKTIGTKTAEEACAASSQALAVNPYDLPFALIYLLSDDLKHARLVGNVWLEAGTLASPLEIEVSNEGVWPLAAALSEGVGSSIVVTDLPAHFENPPSIAWPDLPKTAAVRTITQPGFTPPAGFLIVGLSPVRTFDDDYHGFCNLIAGQIASNISNARAYEEERRRAEALAEIDRVKTVFFSNVSHEFRTPLTLMLGPIEDLISKSDDSLMSEDREQLNVVHRNSLRLLKLVNTLLDFSRIEAGRIQASYEPTDLPGLTAELSSVFRSAIEKAGMRLIVDCPPLPDSASVYVDKEMWEKIVFNLLSNAFKFTFEGEIRIRLRYADNHIELNVQDTGTGIPQEELPHIFERFHRVQNARSRTHEGSGIGLALVQELVKLHSGTIGVSSTLGRGTTFTVKIPTGSS